MLACRVMAFEQYSISHIDYRIYVNMCYNLDMKFERSSLV
jgi:hypothetical protein